MKIVRQLILISATHTIPKPFALLALLSAIFLFFVHVFPEEHLHATHYRRHTTQDTQSQTGDVEPEIHPDGAVDGLTQMPACRTYRQATPLDHIITVSRTLRIHGKTTISRDPFSDFSQPFAALTRVGEAARESL